MTDNNMTENKALKTIMRRIGMLAIRIQNNPEFSFDVAEKDALVWIVNKYQELKTSRHDENDDYGNK